MSEYYKRKAEEDAERREAQHALTMANRRSEIARSPGSFNPWEKQAVNDYYRQKEDARRFDESQGTARGQWGYTDEYGVHHAGGAEKVAEFGYQGQRDAGSTAANITADATKHTADKNLEGIQAQAKGALELEREKQKFLDIINGRDNDTKIRQSEIEWGIHKPDGTFVPGGRVRQAEEQGKAAAQVAAQNNQAKVTVAQLNAQGKQVAAQIASDSRVKAAIAGNVMFANDPAKAQEMIETMMANGFTPQQIYAAFGVQGEGAGTGTVQQTKGQKAVTGIQGEIDRRRRFGG